MFTANRLQQLINFIALLLTHLTFIEFTFSRDFSLVIVVNNHFLSKYPCQRFLSSHKFPTQSFFRQFLCRLFIFYDHYFPISFWMNLPHVRSPLVSAVIIIIIHHVHYYWPRWHFVPNATFRHRTGQEVELGVLVEP